MTTPKLATPPTENLHPTVLPAKLWCHVFRYLTVVQLRRVRLVCSHWKRLVDCDPALNDRITFKFPRGVAVNEWYRPSEIRVKPAYCQSVSFSESSITHIGGWWTEIGRNLTDLRLKSHCYVKIPALFDLLRSCPQLTRLELDGLKHGKISLKIAVDFKLERLEELVLINVIQPSILNLFGKLRPTLKKLVYDYQDPEPLHALASLLRASQSTLEDLTAPFSTAVMEELRKLERLRLKRVGFSWRHGVAQILAFCKLQPELKRLDLSKLALTDSTFREIAGLLPNLQHLSVRFEWESTDLVPSFLASLPHLQALTLEGPELLKGSKRITKFGPYRCPRLTQFQLSCFTLPSGGQDLHQFFGNCSQIRRLGFTRCKFGKWSDFLGALGQLSNLERLEMSQVLASDWKDTTELFTKNLKYLKLEHLDIPKENLIKLLCSFPNLEELHLFKVKFLDDRVVHKFCQQMSKLTKITIDNCQISSISLHHINRYCKLLEQLNLSKIANLSNQEVNQLRKSVEIVRFQPKKDLNLKKYAQIVGFSLLLYYIFHLFGFAGVIVILPVLFLLYPMF